MPEYGDSEGKYYAACFSLESYLNPQTGEWELGDRTRVRISYNYWPHKFKPQVSKISDRAIVYDMIYTWETISHRGANGEPKGLNVLFGDGHVNFITRAEVFGWDAWHPAGASTEYNQNSGPGDRRNLFLGILELVENLDIDGTGTIGEATNLNSL